MKKPSKSFVLAVLTIVVWCFVLLYIGHRYIGPVPVPGPVIPEGSHTVIWLTKGDGSPELNVLLKIDDRASIERLRDAMNTDYRHVARKGVGWLSEGSAIAFCFDDGRTSIYSVLGRQAGYLYSNSNGRRYEATQTFATLESLYSEGKVSAIDWDEVLKFVPAFIEHKIEIEARERGLEPWEFIEEEFKREREAAKATRLGSDDFVPAPATAPAQEDE